MLGLCANLIAQSSPGGTLEVIDKIARVPISKILVFAVVLTVVRLVVAPYLKKTEPHKRTGVYGFVRFVNEVSDALVYAGIVVFMLVRPFGIQTFYIPTPSMVDTLKVGDFIVANKLVYRGSDPKFGDIVVFKPPKVALREGQEDSDFIKRCIGTPGDVIEMKSWELYRNGEKVTEDYKVISDPSKGYLVPADKSNWSQAISAMQDFKLVEYEGQVVPVLYRRDGVGGVMVNAWESAFTFPTSQWGLVADLPAAKVPPGMYLMIGDNRNGSSDGRFWGLVPRSSIIGKAEFVWLPLRHMRGLGNPHKSTPAATKGN